MYDDDGKLVYLYRIIDGLCTRSHAFSAALTVGLPESVIQRANEVRFSDPNSSETPVFSLSLSVQLLEKIETNQIVYSAKNFADMTEYDDYVHGFNRFARILSNKLISV